MSNWRMPIESHPQERVFMAWPASGGYLFTDATSAAEAYTAWASVANAITEHEHLTMLVNPGDEKIAKKYLARQVELVTAPLNDAWMRDIGPSFVIGENGELGAVNYVFNGWGAQRWAKWDKDQHVGKIVAELAGATIINSEMVNEGGGIQVDGIGRVIVTDTVQLDPGRNPGWSKAQVEDELRRTIGTTGTLWLPRGLTRDSDEFGTRGHSDILAAFASEDVLLMHEQTNPAHPDYAISKENIEITQRWLQERGDKTAILTLPAPEILRDSEGFVDYSYINHLVINNAVIACGFGEKAADQRAHSIMAEVYPGREIVNLDARDIFTRGGGIHCITQQQPAV
ncbi:agmatine deiminase family protein [Canibacter zhuwentaonis]|uniref:agmatine deiminase family protein n=1 Tax=Canibacter zhuwentaonis TaxID=2837491 RepID=UPI0032B3480D